MKMPIRVYNRFLDLQIETDAYQSLQYKRSYHGVGDFELHINRYMHGAEYFQKGNIIALNKQENKAGLIVSREIALDESGKESENFKLTGFTLDGLMNRRVSVPPADTAYDRKSGDAETVMKHYVYNHFVNPADSSRKLDMLEIAPNQNRGEHVSWESRFKNIGEELEKISIESGLGWGIFVDFNTKKLVFDCFQAKNLTQNNEFGYSPVFFSPEFETIKSQSFIDSDQDYKNVGYVGGQGEGKERKIIELGNSTGWDRIETFVDARDVGTEDEESEEELTDEEIEKQLIDRGKSKMKEMETVFSLEAEILTPITRKAYEYTHEGYLHPAQPKGRYEAKQQQVTPFQYEKDFDLGDRVQVVNKSWGLTMTAPITEFLEIHESGGFRLEGTFGESRPNLITKIQDKFNELEGIEKQEAPASVAVGKMKEALKYTDDKLTEEERKRIEQAMENLEKSMEHTKDYTYDKEAIDDKDKQVEDSAKQDATDKANAAQEAAEKVAEAKAQLAEEKAIANADGKITEEEKKRIKQAEENLSAAKAEAKAKADAAERAANAYSEEEDKKVKEEAAKDAKEKADQAEKNANDFSKNADNIMEGILDVGTVPIRTAYSGARIEFDGTNGFVVYDKNGNATQWFDLDGNASIRGRIEASEGYFGDNLSLKDGNLEIIRPDGAISMTDGMVRESQSVNGINPMYMGNQVGVYKANGTVSKRDAFQVFAGYFENLVGYLDGRLSTSENEYRDVRDGDYRSSVRIQRYYFVHTARYFKLTYRSRTGSEQLGENLHRHLALIYDKDDNKLADINIPENTTETIELIVDLGKPSYSDMWLDFRVGWASGWGNTRDYIRFRINSVVQTDFV